MSKEIEIPKTRTLVSMGGIPNQTHLLVFNWSPEPTRTLFAQGWPDSPEQNLTNLATAGLEVDRGVTVCRNCGGMRLDTCWYG
jgi:hypothetical protein